MVDLKHSNGKSTKGPGNPIKFSRTNEESFSPAPVKGENTDDIFSDLLNYTELEIGDLRGKGVIG